MTALLMGQLKAGDHIVAARALFGFLSLLSRTCARFSIASTLVDGANLDEWRAALVPKHQDSISSIADRSEARACRHRRRRRDSCTARARPW